MEQITTDALRRMEGREGLIIQGCGGDLQEWADGINDMLTEQGILLNDSWFENVFIFQRGNLTNLLFPFDGVELDMGQLAMWRLITHSEFGGTWLSDYVSNELGGFDQEVRKPDCQLIGEDGNIFNLTGIAARTLRANGLGDQAKELLERIMGEECHDYSSALRVIAEYVNITWPDEPGMEMGGM